MDLEEQRDKHQFVEVKLAVPNPNAQIAYQEFTLQDLRDQLSTKACFARAGIEYEESEFPNSYLNKRRGSSIPTLPSIVSSSA